MPSVVAGRIVGRVHPLVRALRAWLSGSRLPALPEGIGVTALQHRLAGTLYHIGAPLSDFDHETCEVAWTQNMAGHLAREAALDSCWPADAPPPLVIKGADLGERLFHDLGARHAADLDVLVPLTDFERLARTLESVVGPPELPQYERYAWETPCSLGFRVDGVLLELHHAPQPVHRARLDGATLWARGETGTLGRVVVRYPAPVDRLLVWLTNQAKGAFHGGLCALLDLAVVLREVAPPWSPLRAAAAEAGLARAYDLALVRLRESGLWPFALPAVRDPRVHAVARLLPPILSAQGYTNDFRFQAIKVWLCDGRARLATLSRAVSSALLTAES